MRKPEHLSQSEIGEHGTNVGHQSTRETRETGEQVVQLLLDKKTTRKGTYYQVS